MEHNPLCQEPGPPGSTCGGCVWHYRGGRGRAVDRCRRHGGGRVGPEAPGCPAYTPVLDCLHCGACCREAYHTVEVGRRDPFIRLHPDRLEERDGRLHIRRTAGICCCLVPAAGAWPCAVYEERPKTCRNFEVASDNCLVARRRLGLTP